MKSKAVVERNDYQAFPIVHLIDALDRATGSEQTACVHFAAFLSNVLQATIAVGTYAPSLSDPQGSSAITAAVQWLEGTLLGTIATSVAVISVAALGLMALSGRVDVRRAITAIIGCFVLFGASSIVAGIQGNLRADASFAPPPTVTAEISPLASLPKRPSNYDPYAGAAVPVR